MERSACQGTTASMPEFRCRLDGKLVTVALREGLDQHEPHGRAVLLLDGGGKDRQGTLPGFGHGAREPLTGTVGDIDRLRRFPGA